MLVHGQWLSRDPLSLSLEIATGYTPPLETAERPARGRWRLLATSLRQALKGSALSLRRDGFVSGD